MGSGFGDDDDLDGGLDVGVQVDTVLLRVALAQATATVWGFRG